MSDIGLFDIDRFAPYVGALLGLIAGLAGWRINIALARARALPAPRFGLPAAFAAAGIAAAALARTGFAPHGYALIAMAGIGSAILAFDLDHRRIPNEWSLATALLGLVDAVATGRGWQGLATGIGGAAFLWAFGAAYAWLRGREGLGLGDVKLVAGLGIWLGPVGLALCFMGASLVTVVVALGFLAFRRLADDPPFGPGLVAAMLLLLVGGFAPI
ncbi:prepilin peptidase [Zavarzinia aquatilis]|uniref:Prepilin type IV endopeptidase peptidase domain-containing protein n=1 Tax=Zavarzinia aquatilis TaxID=2211142 RepID=A0A317EEI5_9PROT|nr:A24 family peptidase [Zavarzinia aquatilis]PWR24684.1 hypothetical protein DKG74_07730 [Zavarzinia aquatilis]